MLSIRRVRKYNNNNNNDDDDDDDDNNSLYSLKIKKYISQVTILKRNTQEIYKR